MSKMPQLVVPCYLLELQVHAQPDLALAVPTATLLGSEALLPAGSPGAMADECLGTGIPPHKGEGCHCWVGGDPHLQVAHPVPHC